MAKKKGTEYEELVAEIVGSFFHNNCTVAQGVWIEGPDGRRDMDVLIEGVVDGKKIRVLVECKDYDKSKTGRVGIELIDSLDSKRHDLSIDRCLICSNSGFTDPALRKAKRKGIGAISVLASGDGRVKIEIIEKVYYLVIKNELFNATFHPHGYFKSFDPSDVVYKKLPVYLWVQNKLSVHCINATSRKQLEKINKKYRFKHPVQVRSNKRKHLLSSVEGSMEVSKSWYSVDVRLDAKSAIYDYLSGQISLTPGENSFQIHGLDIAGKGGDLVEELPEDSELGVTFNESKTKLVLMMVEGLNFRSNDDFPDLDKFVVPEDIAFDVDKP